MSKKSKTPTFQSLYEDYLKNVKVEHEKLSKNVFSEKLNTEIKIPSANIPEHMQGILFDAPNKQSNKKKLLQQDDAMEL